MTLMSDLQAFTDLASRTSAYITDSDDFVTVASVETTQDWKDFSRSLLQVDREAKYVTRKYFLSLFLFPYSV
jgi:hypothetical protein